MILDLYSNMCSRSVLYTKTYDASEHYNILQWQYNSYHLKYHIDRYYLLVIRNMSDGMLSFQP